MNPQMSKNMSKKVVFNGIEILTDESDSSARSLLEIVESIIGHLESDLEQSDENFHLSLNMDFVPNRRTKHSFSLTSLSNNETRGRVLKILRESTNLHKNKISGTVKVDLQIMDG
jgi:hypothetical protein